MSKIFLRHTLIKKYFWHFCCWPLIFIHFHYMKIHRMHITLMINKTSSILQSSSNQEIYIYIVSWSSNIIVKSEPNGFKFSFALLSLSIQIYIYIAKIWWNGKIEFCYYPYWLFITYIPIRPNMVFQNKQIAFRKKINLVLILYSRTLLHVHL
jgi:hypothetical protein